LTEVLAYTHLKQNIRDDIVDLANELEEFVIRQVLECKLALCDITRVRLAKHSMAVAGNNLPALQSRPDVLLDRFVTSILSNLGLHFREPDEDLLVREAMQRTSKAIERGRIGKEGI
jgi:hypothetical protein